MTVAAGGLLQAAINASHDGDVLCLASGTWTGPFTLPYRGPTQQGWVTIRPLMPDAAFALPGIRIKPGLLLPKITGGSLNAVLQAAPRARGYRLIGLDLEGTGGVGTQTYFIIALGSIMPGVQTADSLQPSDIVIERSYVHGTPTSTVRRCIGLLGARQVVVDSWIDECHENGSDSQAIWGANGRGPYRIENNRLSGATMAIMFGGDDPKIPGLVPADITIRRNHLIRPLGWKGVWTNVKNIIETKNAERVLIEGNVLENSWNGGQQFAVVIKSTNQSGSCPWCRSAHITFRRNEVRNVWGGFQFAGHEASTAPVEDSLAHDILIEDNVVTVSGAPNGTAQSWRMVQLTDSLRAVAFRGNVFVGTGPKDPSLLLYIGDQSVHGLTWTGNAAALGEYGLFGDKGLGEGAKAFTLLGTPPVWSGCFIGSATGRPAYPAGTTFVASEAACPSAAITRAKVAQATVGVVIP